MPPISVKGKPQIIDPPNMIGSLLMVSLSEAPEESWLQHMQWPADDITVEATAFRIPMTGACGQMSAHS